jgi:hypothetical protein
MNFRLAVAIKPYPALRHFLLIITEHSPSRITPYSLPRLSASCTCQVTLNGLLRDGPLQRDA